MNTRFLTRHSVCRKFTGILVLLGCCLASWADTAQDMLNQAQALEKSRSYKAELANGSGKMFQRANRDGTVYFRIELGGENGLLTLKNSSGTFFIYPSSKQAVREADNDKKEPNFDKYATYTMSEGEYEKIPCYIVTRNIPITDKTFKIFRDWFPGAAPKQSPGELRKIFKDSFATKEIFWISKENNVIYAKANYNSVGKFLNERKYSRVDLDPSLPDDLFEIPVGYTIKRAIDMQDFNEQTGDIVFQEAEKELNQHNAANQPGFWSTLPRLPVRALSGLWEWLLAYGNWFFLTVGVAAVAVIATMKWREKKRR